MPDVSEEKSTSKGSKFLILLCFSVIITFSFLFFTAKNEYRSNWCNCAFSGTDEVCSGDGLKFSNVCLLSCAGETISSNQSLCDGLPSVEAPYFVGKSLSDRHSGFKFLGFSSTSNYKKQTASLLTEADAQTSNNVSSSLADREFTFRFDSDGAVFAKTEEFTADFEPTTNNINNTSSSDISTDSTEILPLPPADLSVDSDASSPKRRLQYENFFGRDDRFQIESFPNDENQFSTLETGLSAVGQLMYREANTNNNNLYTCSGTLVGERTVLTASHCVYRINSDGTTTTYKGHNFYLRKVSSSTYFSSFSDYEGLFVRGKYIQTNGSLAIHFDVGLIVYKDSQVLRDAKSRTQRPSILQLPSSVASSFASGTDENLKRTNDKETSNTQFVMSLVPTKNTQSLQPFVRSDSNISSPVKTPIADQTSQISNPTITQFPTTNRSAISTQGSSTLLNILKQTASNQIGMPSSNAIQNSNTNTYNPFDDNSQSQKMNGFNLNPNSYEPSKIPSGTNDASKNLNAPYSNSYSLFTQVDSISSVGTQPSPYPDQINFPTNKAPVLVSLNGYLSGYPSSQAIGTMWVAPCVVHLDSQQLMSSVYRNWCDGGSGMSGGPLLLNHYGRWIVAGVFSTVSAGGNQFAGLQGTTNTWLRNRIQ